MKRYGKRSWLVMVFAVLVMLVAAAVVSADDDTVDLPQIADGRVNSYDIAAPVAIYDYYAYPYADDVDAGVLDRIEFWGLDGQKVLTVSRQQLVDTPITTGSSALVASGNGYSLYKEADGSLTAVVGNYQFNWTPGL
ncbi:MAG: hypothetical protein U0521_28290 [Anaerolineae bacterium]